MKSHCDFQLIRKHTELPQNDLFFYVYSTEVSEPRISNTFCSPLIIRMQSLGLTMTLRSWFITRGLRARIYASVKKTALAILFTLKIALLFFLSLSIQAQTLFVNTTSFSDAEVLYLSYRTLFYIVIHLPWSCGLEVIYVYY